MTPERRDELLAKGLLEDFFEKIKDEELAALEKRFYARLESEFKTNQYRYKQGKITYEVFQIEERRIMDMIQQETFVRRDSPRASIMLILICVLLGLGYWSIRYLKPPPPEQQSVFISLINSRNEARLSDSEVYVYLAGMGKGHELDRKNQVRIFLSEAMKKQDVLCTYLDSEDWVIEGRVKCFVREDSIQMIPVKYICKEACP